jgi:hypothetical protein
MPGSAGVNGQVTGDIFNREGFYLVNLGNTDPYNESEPDLYSKPEQQIRADDSPAVDVRLPSTCSLAQTAACRPDLDFCLLRKPTAADSDSICGCYLEHGACYVRSGCREALPDQVVEFCFNTMRCRRTQCDGTAASSATLSLLAAMIAAALVAASLSSGSNV